MITVQCISCFVIGAWVGVAFGIITIGLLRKQEDEEIDNR